MHKTLMLYSGGYGCLLWETICGLLNLSLFAPAMLVVFAQPAERPLHIICI